MKVGVDGTMFTAQLTGIGNYVRNLLCAVARLMPADEFVVLVNQTSCIIFTEPNINVVVIDGWPARQGYYWKLLGLGLAAQRERVDVFWMGNGMGPVWPVSTTCFTVYDFVYAVAPETMTRVARWFRTFNQPFWIKRADALFSISDAVSAEIHTRFGHSANAVIRPAASEAFRPQSEETIASLREKYSLPDNYAVIVGTLEPRKNVGLFVEEYLALRRSRPDCTVADLVLVGASGWKDSEFLKAIETGEREGTIRRLGFVPTEDLPALYSGAAVLFMPSRYEGFGMPILEARKCGCPVVCSDVPAMHEAGGTGALYHAPTREGIRWALEEVFVNKHVPQSDGGSGVDWTWESGAEQLAALLRETAATR